MRPGPGERSVFRDVLRRQWDARRRRSPHVGHPTFIDGLRLTNVLERHGGSSTRSRGTTTRVSSCPAATTRACACGPRARASPVAVPCTPATSTTSSATSSSRTAAAHDASPPRATVTFASSTSNAASRPTPPEGEDGGSPTRTTTHPPRVPSFATKRGNPSPHGEYRHGHESALRPRRPQRLPRHPSRRPSASLRPASARRAGANRVVVVDLSVQGSTSDIAFGLTNPCLFAVGCDDPFVRVFDVRHARRTSE